ncbi:hypothetical protein DDE01_18740 [Desulfovibrio desulfuricans]|nr:hypothetical protein DDE01_18740 [Desulfovibrio desulfuricans]
MPYGDGTGPFGTYEECPAGQRPGQRLGQTGLGPADAEAGAGAGVGREAGRGAGRRRGLCRGAQFGAQLGTQFGAGRGAGRAAGQGATLTPQTEENVVMTEREAPLDVVMSPGTGDRGGFGRGTGCGRMRAGRVPTGQGRGNGCGNGQGFGRRGRFTGDSPALADAPTDAAPERNWHMDRENA